MFKELISILYNLFQKTTTKKKGTLFKLILWGQHCCSVSNSHPTLSDTMDCSTPGFSVLHYLPESEGESCSVESNSLQRHGLYSQWNSLGQNTGVGSLSLLQRIFPINKLNPGLSHCRWIISILENSMDCIVHKVSTSWTWLSNFHYQYLPEFSQNPVHWVDDAI